MVYSDIEYWASVLDESDKEKERYQKACQRFCESVKNDEETDVSEAEDESKEEKKEDVDEAAQQFKVDDNYIQKALSLLDDLSATNQVAYNAAVKYLDMQKGRYLVVSPEDFAKRRIEMATAAPEPEDTRSVEQKRADAIKKAADSWDEFKKKVDAPKENPIKSIWVKDITESSVTLVIEYKNGKTEETTEDITIAEDDKYYKQIAQSIRAGRRAANDPRKVTVKDVQLSMLRIQYSAPEIQWFYGKAKAPESKWAFAEEVKKQSRSKTSPIAKSYVAWQSEYGSKAKIYRS